MVSIEEADKIMAEFVKLRETYEQTRSKEDYKKYKEQETLCIEKFDYLIKMRTGKYRLFSNYEDLNQDGRVALLNAMKTYKADMGNWFAWAHQYIETKVRRNANLHTAIRYPLKVAKEVAPHKENYMPEIVEEVFCPDTQMETNELSFSINSAIGSLNKQQQKIINMAFGFEGDKPMSINKICHSLKISRAVCIKEIKEGIANVKSNIAPLS